MKEAESVSKLSESMFNYGIGIVVLAFFMVIFFGIVFWLIKEMSKMMKQMNISNIKSIKDELKDLGKINKEALKNLSESINNVYAIQSKEIENMKDSINHIHDTIDDNKTWDLQSYKVQVKQILKLSIIEIKDYIYNKIEQNSLYENYDIIIKEVDGEIDTIIEKGREHIKSIPYKEKFDYILFNKTDKLKQEAKEQVRVLLKVDKYEYNSSKLKRKVNILSRDMMTGTEKCIDEVIKEVENGS